jgi:hypothetical protein
MSDESSNTGEKQGEPVIRSDGRFVKGDKRINRNGRPRSFDQLRKLAQNIAHERIADGSTITAAEAILRQMAHDNPARFIEIAFGKVPEQIEHTGTLRLIEVDVLGEDQSQD